MTWWVIKPYTSETQLIQSTMHVIVIDTETTGLIPKGIDSRNTTRCPYIIQLSYMVMDTSIFKIREDYDAIIRLNDDVEISERSIEIHKITREISKTRGVPINVALYNLKQAVLKYDVGLIVGHNIEFDTQMLDIECRRTGLSGLFGLTGLLTGTDHCQRQRNSNHIDQTGPVSTSSSSSSSNTGSIPLYCTMENSKDICNNRVQSMYGGTYTRFSKLGEVFEKLFAAVDKPDTSFAVHDGTLGMESSVPQSTSASATNESRHSAFMHNSRVDVVMCLRIFVWIIYSVDIKTEWADVMSTYTDDDLIVVDDAHLITDEIAREKYDICGYTLVHAN